MVRSGVILSLSLAACSGVGDRAFLPLADLDSDIEAVIFAFPRDNGIELYAADLVDFDRFEVSPDGRAGEVHLLALPESLEALGIPKGALTVAKPDECLPKKLPTPKQTFRTIWSENSAPDEWEPTTALPPNIAEASFLAPCTCQGFTTSRVDRFQVKVLAGLKTVFAGGRLYMLGGSSYTLTPGSGEIEPFGYGRAVQQIEPDGEDAFLVLNVQRLERWQVDTSTTPSKTVLPSFPDALGIGGPPGRLDQEMYGTDGHHRVYRFDGSDWITLFNEEIIGFGNKQNGRVAYTDQQVAVTLADSSAYVLFAPGGAPRSFERGIDQDELIDLAVTDAGIMGASLNGEISILEDDEFRLISAGADAGFNSLRDITPGFGGLVVLTDDRITTVQDGDFICPSTVLEEAFEKAFEVVLVGDGVACIGMAPDSALVVQWLDR